VSLVENDEVECDIRIVVCHDLLIRPDAGKCDGVTVQPAVELLLPVDTQGGGETIRTLSGVVRLQYSAT
jgi:hypothetical protein